MTRKTSIETYREIQENGLLSKMRWQVYSYLFENGPMTCRELMMGIQTERGRDFVIAGSSLSTRFSELERLGVIENIQERPCRETGRTAIEWDVTDKLPKTNKESKMEKLLREERQLKKRLAQLQDQIKKEVQKRQERLL